METPCIIPYAPRPLQWRFHQQRTRFCVLLCHRRFGKTVAAVNDLLRAALRTSRADWRAAYAAPYLGQAKAVAWDYLRHFAGVIPGTRFHEGELRCDLPNGARIRLYGTDNAQALRGLYLDDLVLDEPADIPREVWSQILRPALADRQGRALFCGTPKGCDNLLHDVWQLAGSLGTAEGWSRFRFPASQTGYLPQAELDAARRGMSEAEYQQEFECSFAAAVRGAYYAAQLDAADLAGRICPLPVSPDLPVHTAWDLGMDDATAIWFFQVEPSGAWRMLDYYEASGEGLAHYAAVLAAKARPEGTATTDGLAGRGFCYGRHLAPHDIRVRELGTGQSRLESAARLGIRFDIAPSLPLADGIDAVRRALPRLWFDSRHCAAGLAALRSYRRQWRPRQEQFSSGPLHDGSSHAADALRYAVTGCAMYAWAHPREDDWLRLVSAPGRLLLQATAPDGTALACGLFSPWRGQIREFDFTVFRPAFPLAVPLARAAFRWVFRHTETSALWGLCPVSNRHARRLATACGFVITGRLPAACWLARRGIHVDGIQLLCTPETLARAIKNSPSCHRATQ